MEVDEVFNALAVGKKGLSSVEVEERLGKYGYNELLERKRVSPLQIFLNQFKDIFVVMLLIAIALSFMIGWYKGMAAGRAGSLDEYVDAITIAAIVILNSVVGFIQEYRSEKAIEAMKKLAAPRARVCRDGKEAVIPAREVVPGDLVILEAGDRIPADARLVDVVEFKTEEAALTGESTPVTKDVDACIPEVGIADRMCMVFMGTVVTGGRAVSIVTSTGMNTEFGKIAGMVQAVEVEEPPLKQKMEKMPVTRY